MIAITAMSRTTVVVSALISDRCRHGAIVDRLSDVRSGEVWLNYCHA